MTDEQRYLSLATIREIYDIHDSTIRTWIREGKLNSIRVGQRHRVLESDLLALIKK